MTDWVVIGSLISAVGALAIVVYLGVKLWFLSHQGEKNQ